MPYRYLLRLPAQKDYTSSVSWYVEISDTVANNFNTAIEKSINSICEDPHVYLQDNEGYYHYYVKDFPYTIIYKIDERIRTVVIRAIYHQKRNPRNKYR